MTSHKNVPEGFPSLENLHLNEIESNGTGIIKLRFDGQPTEESYNELNIFLVDVRLACAQFECIHVFPLTKHVEIYRNDANIWTIDVGFNEGKVLFEAKKMTYILSSRNRGRKC
ncbi:hypothetical protein [Methylocystis parvus]|uniref:Uncharacterized protein n=1 Tax=Methylocystis parvus TaxID=134 RepID=A0A6B8M7A0_9HYPH|nr:hypothetical protein [Methylocystis parvus]QGM98378.1 hypothetical protein F7D14_13415 [Methylocystis parvus]WBK01290.1 hypothetical protein MMG94_06150 [Methylocystis parvus OBBP]